MRTNFFAACTAALLASSSSGLDLSALAASPETVLNVDPALEPLILAATDTEVNKKTNDKYHERSR